MNPDDISRIAFDPQFFEVFYREHVEAVQRFVARRVRDPYLAADLTADVFLAAIDSAHSYDPRRGNPTAWLSGVARNVVLAEHRRSARDVRLRERIDGQRLLADDDIERLQERIDAAQESRELAAAIARLPESERAVLELVALDELSVTDAAAALGIRAVTARVRLHRARATLRNTTAGPRPAAVATSRPNPTPLAPSSTATLEAS
jgi:RNA polymerase sigma-70 factor (ECF subfamily)